MLLNEILTVLLIALFNSLINHFFMPFNSLLVLFTVMQITRVGKHKGWKAALIECAEAKANTVKNSCAPIPTTTIPFRYPHSSPLLLLHILFFCLNLNEAILPIAF